MNQLKFIRSKSTTRSSPLKRIHQKLRQVQKPGKLNVSVGKSRQTSENKETLQMSTPKEKVQRILQLLSNHQRNNQGTYLETPERTQKAFPLSHERKLFNESMKLQDSAYGFYTHNIYHQQTQNDQISNQLPQMEESTITEKVDAFQLKFLKVNSQDQITSDQQSPSAIVYGNTKISQFNQNKEILKQSFQINQQQNKDQKYYNSQQHQQFFSKNIPQSQYHSRKNSINNQQKENLNGQISKESASVTNNDYNEIILEIYPQFLKQYQQIANKKKIINEKNEEHCPTKLSMENLISTHNTKSPQQVKLYSELLTDKSLVLISPKTVKDIEMQTSFTQPINNNKSQENVEKQSIQTQFDTVNACVQTKQKKKNLGLFQYQFSYLSPQNNKNRQNIDLLSLGDFQSEILHRTQSDFERDFHSGNKQKQEMQIAKIKDFNINPQTIQRKQQTQQQNDSRSFLMNQKSNVYLSREQLLDPQEDNHPYYLQAEPKEMNSNCYLQQVKQDFLSLENSKQSSANISSNKLEKGSSFLSTQCYKDHLNILLSQSQQGNVRASQHDPYLNQSSSTKNKQKYSLRTTSKSNQKTKKKQNCLNTKK